MRHQDGRSGELIAAAEDVGLTPETSPPNRWPHNATLEPDIREEKECCRAIHLQSGLPYDMRTYWDRGLGQTAEKGALQKKKFNHQTWIELPPELRPSWWRQKFARPLVLILRALYGHPEAGELWEQVKVVLRFMAQRAGRRLLMGGHTARQARGRASRR